MARDVITGTYRCSRTSCSAKLEAANSNCGWRPLTLLTIRRFRTSAWALVLPTSGGPIHSSPGALSNSVERFRSNVHCNENFIMPRSKERGFFFWCWLMCPEHGNPRFVVLDARTEQD